VRPVVSTAGRLPDFVVIGAMKAGTTSLWEALRAHPQVFVPELKELHFFSNPGRLGHDMAWYREQFAGAGDARAVGEASTNYTKYPRLPGTAERLADAIPAARLVYLVRDPIERIRSHYLHVVHSHGERRPIDEAVHADPEYVDISRYSLQIDQYLEHFDESQLLVVTSESLKQQPRATMERVFRFVGVDVPERVAAAPVVSHRSADKRMDTPFTTRLRGVRGYRTVRGLVPASVRRLAARAVKPPLEESVDATVPDPLRRELADRLADDVRGLRRFLGPSFDGWGIA
jgi:hypothetical protein